MNAHENASKAGLSATLLALGLLLATQLPSAGLGGGGTTANPSSRGKLVVTVVIDSGFGFSGPLQGVQVGVSLLGGGGLRVTLQTNSWGVTEFAVPAGSYGVSASDSEFSLSSEVSVSAVGSTRMLVTVHRTAYTASFASAEDSTAQGEIEPWNTVVVMVTLRQLPVSAGTYGLLRFNGTVFIQPVSLTRGLILGFGAQGTEVQATIVSQVVEPGETWLTLRPDGLLRLAGATFLQVVSYQANSTVASFHG